MQIFAKCRVFLIFFLSQFLFSRRPELQLTTPVQKFTGSKYRGSYFREIGTGAKSVKICTMRKFPDIRYNASYVQLNQSNEGLSRYP